MIQRFSNVLVVITGTFLALGSIAPAEARGPRQSPSCVASQAAGISKIGSASDGTALEVCLARSTNTATEQPARSSSSKSLLVSKAVCSSSTVTLRLGPPTFQTRTFRQTICKGQSTTIEVANFAPQPNPSRTSSKVTNRSSAQPGSIIANQTANQDSKTLKPDSHRISPDNISIATDTKLTLASLAKAHYKTATVLGEQLSVRFVPVGFEWLISGPAKVNQTASAQNLEVLFTSPGSYQIKVVVQFESEFQLAGATSWLRESRVITSTAFAKVEVLTPGVISSNIDPKTPNPINRDRGFARLAASDCIINPAGVGCTR